ncbi:MAG: TolC family outer membrane protein [Pseudomonadota bacterium]
MELRKSRMALALGAALGLAAPAEAQTTLADALARAYENSPRLAAQRADVRARVERELQARGEAFGTIEGTSSYQLQNRDAPGTFGGGRSRDDSDPFSLGVSGAIPLYSGGRIENATQAARQSVLAGRSTLDSVEQEVLLAAVTAYEDVRRDIALVGVARSNVRVIGEQLRAARDRFEVGEVTRTDVSQAEARLAAARSTLAARTGALARSRQAYRAAVGELPDDLQPPPPLPDLPESETAAIALAESQHPDLRAARFAVAQAEFGVKRAIGGMLPSVSLEGGARYEDGAILTDDGGISDSDTNAVNVGVRASVPLWTGGRNPSSVREAQAQVAQAQAQVHDVARSIREAVSNAWSGLEVARATITAARQQIRAAQIAFEGVREEATLGARTTLDVLNAEQELQSARADLISALRDEYVAGYQLLAAVGSLTVGHLGLEVEGYDPDAYRRQVEADWLDYPRTEATEWSSSLRP